MRRLFFTLITLLSVYCFSQDKVCIIPDTSKAVIIFTSNGCAVIDAEFSLSDSTKVRFAHGNLMYQPSTNKWKIADRQFDIVGGVSTKDPVGTHGTMWVNGKRCTNKVSDRTKYDGWLDLFSWGASGWYGSDKESGEDSTESIDYRKTHNPYGKVTANPYEINSRNNFYLGNSESQGMVGEYANADWGIYHNLELGGTPEESFRSPTYEEWMYLFFERDNAEKLLGHATILINGNNDAPDTLINGVLLLPNDWEERKPVNFHFNDYTHGGNTYNGTNTYTVDEWNYMEGCGAVFLPAAGGASNNNDGDKFNRSGFYWVGTPHNGKVYDINFGPVDAIEIKPNSSRWYGRAVRLCQDIKQ